MQDINKAARRLLGYEPRALMGRHFSMLFPEESQTVADQVLNDPRTHDAVIAEQYFARRDGTRCAMDLTVTMIPWKRDRALLVTLRDVTERVQAEAQTMENERVRVELEAERAMVEMRNNFVSMVSHEFRTPLTVITTSKDLLERYHDRLTDEKRIEHLHKIGAQARHMADMIDDILLLNRSSAGVSSVQYELVDMEAFCRDVSEHVVMSWPQHEIVLEFDGDLRRVRTSPQALDHIIANLLSNAFKYSPVSSTIICRAERKDGALVISVHDDGIGIDADAIERLFEPFYRAPNSQNVRGTGLGLAIVKQHIDQLNGIISVDSMLGKGTTFTVRIPI
jgi:PAS domain S-box-containing protein